MENEHLDSKKVLERSNKILKEKSQVYWVEFFCMEKTNRIIKDRTDPKFYKIPGRYLSVNEAEEIYHKQYEDKVETVCNGKYSIYVYIKTLTDAKKNERIIN